MKQRTLVLSVAVCVSGLLVIPVWPQFVGGAITAPYENTLPDIARGKKVNPAILTRTETALRVARKWTHDGKVSAAIGGLRFVAARSANSAESQRAALLDSIVALKQGLQRAPAQPYAWLQLAQSERAYNGATPALENYLAQSMKLARWEHRLVMPRLEIALGVWPVLSPGFKSNLPAQVERAIDTAPLALARATRRTFALRAVRQMLADSPVHLDRFRIVYLSPD